MKQILQIIGNEVVSKNCVKLVCIPFTSKDVKAKRPSLFELASGGMGVQELMQQAQENQSCKTVLFVTMDEYLSVFKGKMLNKIVVDIGLEG